MTPRLRRSHRRAAALLLMVGLPMFTAPVNAQDKPAEPGLPDPPAGQGNQGSQGNQGKATQGTGSLPAVDIRSSRQGAGGEGYLPETSNTGTKVPARLKDVPQTINVINAEVLEDQRATSIQDALRNVPGVGFSNGDGQRDQVMIRGFSAIADQFVDGVRDDALYFRDLSNIDRIEVIKGPAAVLYGRGSSGGLINRVTRQPGRNVGEFVASYGSWKTWRTQWDVGRADNEVLAWRLTGAVEQGDSYRSQGFIDRRTIAPSALLRLSSATQLLLQADHLEDKRVNDFGIPSYQGRPVSVPAATYYGAANARDADYVFSRVSSATATLNHRFSDALSLRNVTRYYRYHLDRNNTNVTGVNETLRQASLSHANVLRDEHGVFNQTELSHKLETGGISHQLLYGLEVAHQNKELSNWSRSAGTVDLFNPVLPVIWPRQVGGLPATSNISRFDTLGLYLQDLVSFSPQWKALVGVRHDRFEQSTDNRLPSAVNPILIERVDRAWSPRLGLTWQPTSTQTYYLSWSRSFQPSGETFALAANNADIAPERTSNVEVGTRQDLLDGRASVSAALFNLERTHIKATDPVSLRLVPLGTQRTRGLDVTVNADLGAGLKLLAGYAYLDTRMVESPAMDAGQAVVGKRATLTPRHAANLWLTHEIGGGFGAGGGLNYVGNRFANPGNTVSLGSYVVANAAAWFERKPFRVQLNVFNLFNRAYMVSGHGTSAFLNTPGAPRSAVLSGTFRF